MERPGASLLILAGLLSAGVAALHGVILFAGGAAYRYFGAGERMARLADRGSPQPTLITTVLIVLFASWAAYAFSGAGLVRPLPRLRVALLLIGILYTARGLVVVPQGLLMSSGGTRAVPVRHIVFSAVSLAAGLVYLAGTFRGWAALDPGSRIGG